MNSIQAIAIGLLQGVTELFPISSLGHSVILPSLLHWNINQNAPYFLSFLVLVHLSTGIVLFFFYFNDWMLIIKGFFSSIAKQKIESPYERLAWLIVIASIPAGLLGLLFEKKLRLLFASPLLVAVFLICNGILLYMGERLKKNSSVSATIIESSDHEISKLTFTQSLKIGCMQTLALLPGFSRTGAAMVGSLRQGLSHENSLRFSFLLATPIIFAASLLKLPELFHEKDIWPQAIEGALAAALAAYLTVKFLTRYFETKKLLPFAYYCIAAGILSLLFLSI